MKLSVIIPSYNGAAVLRRSLDTWYRQTLPLDDYEVILVDNNSTDSTAEIAKEYQQYPNFRYVKELTPGATQARHAGVKPAKSNILVFADNDGLFNSTCLQAIWDMYEQDKKIAAVTGKIELLWDREAPEWIAPYEFMLGKLNYGDEPRCGYDLYLNGGLFSIRKTVFEGVHGFNPDLVGRYLIGDGDTGLVNKLHNNNLLIAYTPDAVMQHLQFVDVHGTEKGLGRHFFNTGITVSYGLFRKNKFSFSKEIAIYLVKNYLVYLKRRQNTCSIDRIKRNIFRICTRKGN
ncbi:MAG: glycosyltransferase family A protein [Paludibacteraceae bacterium]